MCSPCHKQQKKHNIKCKVQLQNSYMATWNVKCAIERAKIPKGENKKKKTENNKKFFFSENVLSKYNVLGQPLRVKNVCKWNNTRLENVPGILASRRTEKENSLGQMKQQQNIKSHIFSLKEFFLRVDAPCYVYILHVVYCCWGTHVKKYTYK